MLISRPGFAFLAVMLPPHIIAASRARASPSPTPPVVLALESSTRWNARNGVKEVTRNFNKKALFGTYRGFDVHILRSVQFSGENGFRFALHGAGDKEYQPNNLVYTFEEKFNLTGLFQRLDNFLAKGLDEAIEMHRATARQETAELETVKSTLGKEFPQMEELALVRENHNAVIRELQRMQDDTGYVSAWKPKTSLVVEPQPMPVPQLMRCG